MPATGRLNGFRTQVHPAKGNPMRISRTTLRGAAVAVAMLGTAFALPTVAANASASGCHTSNLSGGGGRAYCSDITGGTEIRVQVDCVQNNGVKYHTSYGPWRSLEGAYSDAYCGSGYTRYNVQVDYS